MIEIIDSGQPEYLDGVEAQYSVEDPETEEIYCYCFERSIAEKIKLALS